MCGVRFMAETVKLLSPEKIVYLSHTSAGCPMAEQMDKEMILSMKKRYPNIPVVAYINTTAELKAVSDVCVTSSSAVKIVRNLEANELIFIPDVNLGTFVQSQVPEKKLHLFEGGCPVHTRMGKEDVARARAEHPNALLLVHPECKQEVVEQADMVGSTAEILDFAARSAATEFIIGTENSIVSHLQYDHPEKRFYPLSRDCICHDMTLTTLPEILACLKGQGGEEIVLSDDIAKDAVRPIHEMLRLG